MIKRILGIDHGATRIGIAVGNLVTGTSQGIKTITAKQGIPNWTELDHLIAEWRPQMIILGLPLQMDATEGAAAKMVKAFGAQVAKHTGLPIEYADERLTSNAADEILRSTSEAGHSLTKKRKKQRDNIAAELILQCYIEENRTSCKTPFL